MLEIDKEILKYNKTTFIISGNFICLTLFMFCIFGFLFLFVKELDFDKNEVYIIVLYGQKKSMEQKMQIILLEQ